jgi:NAD(P)-dependent dehydrogenase (short-subunit alcohol dehydrogenase family)
VLTLSSEKISKLINGRVIPNDRVFYPVKPIVGTAVDGVGSNNGSNNELPNIKGKVVVLTSTSSRKKEIDKVKRIAKALGDAGAKQTIVLTNDQSIAGEFREFHSHVLDLSDEDAVRRIFNTARKKFEKIDAVVHFTGDYDYESPLTNLARNQWDLLVDNFINIPGLITRESVNAMAPQGAVDEPKKYKDSKGFVIIVGPDAPVGRKISGTVRARSDVFRGALRPYTATVNQELADVLGSKIRLYLVLGGNTEGTEPNADKLESSIMHLLSGSALARNESIFYIDEARI